MQKNDEAGFTLLSVLIAVMIIGVMTAIAVPRLSAMMTRANTARIQSDLTTIDTSIALYQTEKGTNPQSLSDLTEYLQNADKLKPPTGKCYIRGQAEPMDVTADATYAISKGDANTGEVRATCLEHTANDFVHDTASKTD